MSVVIDKDVLKKIIRDSYEEIKKYEQKTVTTKLQTRRNIAQIVEKEIRNAHKQD